MNELKSLEYDCSLNMIDPEYLFNDYETTSSCLIQSKSLNDLFQDLNSNLNANVQQSYDLNICTSNFIRFREVIQDSYFLENDIEEKRSTLSALEFRKYLFSDDIRKSYIRIIVDAINSGSRTHLKNTLSLLLSKTCVLKEFFALGVNPSYREFKGTDEIYFYFQLLLELIPDLIVTVHDFIINQFEVDPKDFSDYKNVASHRESLNTIPKDSSGVAMMAKCCFSGKRIFGYKPINENDAQKAGKYLLSKFSYYQDIPDLRVVGHWAILLNKKGKIVRLEFHLQYKQFCSQFEDFS